MICNIRVGLLFMHCCCDQVLFFKITEILSSDFDTQHERLKVISFWNAAFIVHLNPPSPLFLAQSSIATLLCWTPKLKQVKYWNLFYEWCCLLPLICSCNNETLIVPVSYLVVKLLRHKPDTLEAMMCFGADILSYVQRCCQFETVSDW